MQQDDVTDLALIVLASAMKWSKTISNHHPFFTLNLNKMKSIIIGLAVVAMAAATSAFTNTKHLDSIQAGILSMEVDEDDNDRLIYTVEEFNPLKSCVNSTPTDACSFSYDAATLPPSVHADDPLISNLNSGEKYQ